ncbi:GTP-binding protein REM 1-like [Brevipalpus obovatus]|uniref:GTP-binding protein REM 1-like n=1 Tax=Brevipalpus obovatus TaxID=246614 RepID=UPI003D9F21E5
MFDADDEEPESPALQRQWSGRRTSSGSKIIERPVRSYSYKRRERYSLRVPKTQFVAREYPRSMESIDDWSLYRPHGSPMQHTASGTLATSPQPNSEPRGARRVQSFRCTSKGGVVKMGDFFLGNVSPNNILCKAEDHSSTSMGHSYHNTHQPDQSSGSLAATRGSPTCSVKSSLSSDSKTFRVFVTGYKNVGKHRLVSACLGTRSGPRDESKTTILIDFEQFNISFQIVEKLEDADEISNESLTSQSLGKCNQALLIVYSVTDRKSFEKAGTLLTLAILRHCRVNPNLSVCLVANKSDLARARVVKTEEGKDLAKRFNTHYIESSAEIGENIEEIMVWIVEKIRENLSVVNTLPNTKSSKQAIKVKAKVLVRARTCIRQIFKKIMFKSKSVENLSAL